MLTPWKAVFAGLLLTFVNASAFAQALPPSIRIAGISQAQLSALQQEVRRAAQARNASEQALAAVAERIGEQMRQDGSLDVARLIAAIDRQAGEVSRLQQALAALTRTDDATVSALRTGALQALEQGRLNDADTLLGQAAVRDLESAHALQTSYSALLARAAESRASQARIAELSYNFTRAADLYGEAADTASDRRLKWRYRFAQAQATGSSDSPECAAAPHGCASPGGSTYHSERAVALLNSQVLPLTSRSETPQEWAASQLLLGEHYHVICGTQLSSCVPMIEALAAAYSILRTDAAQAAQARHSFARGLWTFTYEVGYAEPAYQAQAATVLARIAAEQSPQTDIQALAQVALGRALLGDESQHSRAVGVLRAAILALERPGDVSASLRADGLCQARFDVGRLLGREAGQTNDVAMMRQAATFHAAAAATACNDTQTRAYASFHQGGLLIMLDDRRQQVSLDEAIAALQGALRYITASSNQGDFAIANANMALAYERLGQRGRGAPAYRQAAQHMRAVLAIFTSGPNHDRAQRDLERILAYPGAQ